MMGFYSGEELKSIGIQEIGENVLISKKASIYLPQYIRIGHDVRIDDFSILIGHITIGNYVHIGSFCGLHASEGEIVFQDYSGISANVTIYACTDSFSGEGMTARPGLPKGCVIEVSERIVLGRYSQIGTGSTVIPHGSIGEGTAIGAMSLVNKPTEPWGIYAGIPAKWMKARERGLLKKVKNLD